MYKIFAGALNDGAKVGLVGKTVSLFAAGGWVLFALLVGEFML